MQEQLSKATSATTTAPVPRNPLLCPCRSLGYPSPSLGWLPPGTDEDLSIHNANKQHPCWCYDSDSDFDLYLPSCRPCRRPSSCLSCRFGRRLTYHWICCVFCFGNPCRSHVHSSWQDPVPTRLGFNTVVLMSSRTAAVVVPLALRLSYRPAHQLLPLLKSRGKVLQFALIWQPEVAARAHSAFLRPQRRTKRCSASRLDGAAQRTMSKLSLFLSVPRTHRASRTFPEFRQRVYHSTDRTDVRVRRS